MDVRSYVFGCISAGITGVNYDREALWDGIDGYIQDNGFEILKEKYTCDILKQIIDNNLSPLMEKPEREIRLFFSNYRLIEDIRLLCNKSLQLAIMRNRGELVEVKDIEGTEMEFEQLTKQVYQREGLFHMLESNISETIQNIDYAKGKSNLMSQRLRDYMG